MLIDELTREQPETKNYMHLVGCRLVNYNGVLFWLAAAGGAYFCAPSEARAQSTGCTSGDAPAAWSGNGCKLGQCTETLSSGTSEQILVCSLDTGGTGGGVYYGVTEYPGSTRSFSFWGTDSDGLNFCCVFDKSSAFPYISVVVVGTPQADLLSWEDVSANLTVPPSWVGTYSISAEMYGEGDDDVLQGATTDTWVSTTFHGGSGADTIVTGGSKPVAYGDLGDDFIDGRASQGADLYGDNSGFAWFLGGSDLIWSGGYGTVVWGNGGHDTLCGSSQADTMYGDAGNDTLWAAGSSAGADTNDGGAGTDSCGGPFATNNN